MKIYIDGVYYEKDEAKISVFDHGLLYGDGVFEGIRIYNGGIFKLKEHIDRLYESARAISLDAGMSKEELIRVCEEAVRLNAKREGYIRLLVTRGDGPLGIDPFQCPKAKIIIIVGDIQLYPAEYYAEGIEIVTSSIRRIPNQCFDVRVKSLNYLNNILAKIEAKNNNCLESIMLNLNGFVAECTGDNLFIVKNGTLSTPSVYQGALEGITRNTIMELAREAALDIHEGELTLYDLYNADECFLTGTGAEIMPVIKIDGRPIGNGRPEKTTLVLTEKFRRLIGR